MNRRSFLRKSFTGAMGLAIVSPTLRAKATCQEYVFNRTVVLNLTDEYCIHVIAAPPESLRRFKHEWRKKVLDMRKKACYIDETELR